MKKLLLLVALAFLTGTMYAQEESAKLKNEGNAAYRAKNYKEALTKWEAYLKLVEFKDDATVYNTAVVANSVKDYATAEKYFDMSIQNKYKPASSYQGKVKALQQQKKTAEMLKTLEEGMKLLGGQAGELEKVYFAHYIKEGQEFTSKGNMTKAIESYKKVTEMSNKAYKSKGFLSIGTLYFNNGATILQKATEVAETDRPKYDSEKERAVAEFNKARENLVKANGASPNDEEVAEVMNELNKAVSALK